jgi:hypothetical protein
VITDSPSREESAVPPGEVDADGADMGACAELNVGPQALRPESRPGISSRGRTFFIVVNLINWNLNDLIFIIHTIYLFVNKLIYKQVKFIGKIDG